jgi:competence protein ComFC
MGKAALYASVITLLRILFPPQCLHCKSSHEKLGTFLCKECVSYLEIRKGEGSVLITFAGIGPAQSLMKELKKHASCRIAALLAAYMAIQYSQTEFLLPDIITAVPSSCFRKWQIGEEIAGNLAHQLGKILDRPYIPLLRRKRQMLRQDFLKKEERVLLPIEDFEWREKHNLRGKKILLIDDTITTGTTLKRCARRLWEASPEAIIKMACLDQGYLQE